MYLHGVVLNEPHLFHCYWDVRTAGSLCDLEEK